MFDQAMDNLGGKQHTDREIDAFRNVVQGTSLSDMWRDLHPNEKQYTWRHLSKAIMRRLDYIFVNEKTHDRVVDCTIKEFPLTDHRSVQMSISMDKIRRGPSYWKMNNALLKEKEYVDNINQLIDDTVETYGDTLSKQCLWDFCKKQVKDFTLVYSKSKAAMRRDEIGDIKCKLEDASNRLSTEPDNQPLINHVTKLKCQLDAMHISSTRGAEIRSKALWAQQGEKSNKFFLTLEKIRGKQKTMTSLRTENTVLTDQKDIMQEQVRFYKELYKKKAGFSKKAVQEFIKDLHLPKLEEGLHDMCDEEITVGECAKALKQMKNDGSPGSDGLTVAWYKVFWSKISGLVLDSFWKASKMKSYLHPRGNES